MTTFLISGGRGLVGKTLGNMLKRQGHTVYKLSRRPKRKGHIYWNPEKQSIEGKHLHKIEVIINLAGANTRNCSKLSYFEKVMVFSG